MGIEQIPLVSDKRVLSDAEVPARLGVSPFTMRAWQRKGQGPRFMKMRRAVRYRPQVRVVLPGRMVHLASQTEPRVRPATSRRSKVDWLADPDYGNPIGCIHWDHVIAVTWRQRPNGTSPSDRE